MKRHFKSVLALAACTLPLQCATLERLSLDDIITKSTAIVRGTVGSSYSALTGRVIYTHYAIHVLERFTGPSQGAVDVAIPGGVANNLRQTFAGAPELKTGEEYIFFLWTGRSGITQVIGLTQGLFSIAPAASADPVATRRASGELMVARGTGAPVKDQTLTMRLSELRSRIAGTLAAGRSVAK